VDDQQRDGVRAQAAGLGGDFDNIIPVELGKLLAGQGNPGQCMATVKERVDKAAAPYRRG
jgi:hypothetical protein